MIRGLLPADSRDNLRSGLDVGLGLASFLGELLVCVSNMDHPIGHRVLSSWVLDIGPELFLNMRSGLVEVWRDSQHLGLTGCDSLVHGEEGSAEGPNSVGQDVLGGIDSARGGRDLDHVPVTSCQR
jgi:hypothetical protein